MGNNWRETLRQRALGHLPGFAAHNKPLDTQKAQLTATTDDAFTRITDDDDTDLEAATTPAPAKAAKKAPAKRTRAKKTAAKKAPKKRTTR